MKGNEIKELLAQNISSKLLKDRKEDLITLMSRLRPGILKISVTAKNISDELSIRIGELCEQHHNVYSCQNVMKTNVDTGEVIDTKIYSIDNDFIDIPVISWSTTEKKMNYYTFVLDPEDVSKRVNKDSSVDEDALMDPFYPIKVFHKIVVSPIIDEYGRDSDRYEELVNADFKTDAICFKWFNVMEDSSVDEPIENPYLNKDDHVMDLNNIDDEVLNSGLVATLDELKIYDKDSGYNELQTVYNLAKYRLIELANSYNVSPKTIAEDRYAEWRKSIAIACVDWAIDLSENIVDYSEDTPVRGYILRYIQYLNRVCSTILQELDIVPSFDELEFHNEERFEQRFKEASDTCVYHALGKYPDTTYERILGYEIRTVKGALSDVEDKLEFKNKLLDILKDSNLVEEIGKIKEMVKENEEKEMVNSDDFKWS